MKKNFLTGLVILLPLVVTIAVILFVVNLLTQPFIGVVSKLFGHWSVVNHGFLFLSPEQVIRYGSQFAILVLLFAVTITLGFIARTFLMKWVFHVSDRIISRIPLVNTVYKTTQDIIKTLFVSDKKSFQQVVLVPFPHPGTYILGLVARESPEACSRAVNEDLISVLVPTTPNPTTGFLLLFNKKDLIFVDMKPEDAIKYIVSCGVIVPKDRSLVPPIIP